MLSKVLVLLNILTVGEILAIVSEVKLPLLKQFSHHFFFTLQRINITNFDNCDDHEDIGKHNTHAVLVKSIQLDYVDRFCDTVHGSYEINTVNTADKKVCL